MVNNSRAEVTFTWPMMLRSLHQRGRLLPMLREAAVDDIIVRQARSAGLVVNDEELQQAADDYRRRHGLTSADETHAWLSRQHYSVEDFESALERDLLIDKLKDFVAQDRIANHFAAHKASYARVRLRQIVVDREDVARELISQIREEGRDFAELARQYGQPVTAADEGARGEFFRRQLSDDMADAVFAASAGEIVGPLISPRGFVLLLVEELRAPDLDLPTAAAIRHELFEAWINERLRRVSITLPLLNAL